MDDAERPKFDLAQEVLPAPLLKALVFIFSQRLSATALVGGTALAGFYAGHRRSDDLDLFVKDEESFIATTAAVKQLASLGAVFASEFQSKQYYKAVCRLEGHSFTVDVVWERNFFVVGSVEPVKNNINVASLKTLLMMKGATLISRASEKDLYDLLWLFKRFPGLKFDEFLQLARQIDGGVSGEAILINLSSTALSEHSCDFTLNPQRSRQQVLEEISTFKTTLIKEITAVLKGQAPSHPLKLLVSVAQKIKR